MDGETASVPLWRGPWDYTAEDGAGRARLAILMIDAAKPANFSFAGGPV